jgi:hypothetical protein
MHFLRGGTAAVLEHDAAEFAHMRVAHRGSDAPIGDDPGKIKFIVCE